MTTAVCAIGRRENRYAREWVDHYIGLGFDHIFICDNNHDGEERFEDVLQDYVDAGRVTIHNYRGRVAVQMQAYTDIYRMYGAQYDWLAFFDFDEFLVMADGLSVKEWLHRFDGSAADCIFVNWMCYGDGGMVHDDGRPCMERFTEPIPYDRIICSDVPEDNYVKSVVRGGLTDVSFAGSPHYPDTARCCRSAAGRPCRRSARQHYDFSVCHLRHFSTKTISEWLGNKWQKGVASWDMDTFRHYYESRFFKFNDHTPEKQAFIDAFFSGGSMSLVSDHQ